MDRRSLDASDPPPGSWRPTRHRGDRSVDRGVDLIAVSVAPEPIESPDARRLIAALDVTLGELYPPEWRFGPNLRPEHLGEGLGTFVIAPADARAVGCGALRRLDDSRAEVKRMWVEPGVRRQGVAGAILDHLEATAREIGARRLVVETDVHNVEALELYRKFGFKPIDCFGEYANAPTGVCLEKLL